MRKLTILLLIAICCVLNGCKNEKNTKTAKIEETQTKLEAQYETEMKTAETKDEAFLKFKNESMAAVEDLQVTDETTGELMLHIESYYKRVSVLSSWGNLDDDFYEFVVAVSYFYSKFEQGTIGHEIGQKGWEAIESLFMEDGEYENKIADFKMIYEESGRKIYVEKYQSGQYKVGVDIDSGEYVFFAEASNGYFCISSDSNGSDIIANSNFSYNSIITIQDGEYLELSRCYAVPIEEATELPIDKADMFKIGTHLTAGEYKLISDDGSGYYCIYSDNRQNDIEANDIFEGQSYVTVLDGQYLELLRCYIESK